ncbi:MAG: Spy/CpxP family protein refolding chaperone [Bacteroidales bacterium]
MAYRFHARVLATLVLVSLVICGAATTFAQDAVKPKAPAGLLRGPYAPILRQLQGLNLTQEQRQQVLGIFEAHKADVKAVGEKLRAARARWEQAGQIDIQERKTLMRERQAVMKGVVDEVSGVLTPEQQKKFQARRRMAARRGF